MLMIKGPSDKPCFICQSKEKTAEVQFADKTFRGVLCMAHVYEKLKFESKAASAPPSAKP
jgi:hypothetical protein